MHQGVVDVLADYPDIEVVSEIYTNWNGSEAQQQLASVLPTLDHVDAIIHRVVTPMQQFRHFWLPVIQKMIFQSSR